MCEKHLKLSQNKPAESDILKHFPDGMVARTKLILTQVLFLTFLPLGGSVYLNYPNLGEGTEITRFSSYLHPQQIMR